MFDALASEIRGLDISLVGPTIVELMQLHYEFTVRLTQAIHRFDQLGTWAFDGAISAKGWLTANTRVSDAAATRILRDGRKLAHLPVTTDAALDGSLGPGHLEAILAAVGNSQVEKFAEYEPTLVPQITKLSVTDAVMVMRHWKNVITSDEEPAPEPPLSLHLNDLPDGRFAVNGTLSQDCGTTVAEAVRQATTDDVEGEPERTAAERRADALGDICRFYLDHHATAGPVAPSAALVVVADLEVLQRRSPGVATRITGQPLTRSLLDRITCDCNLHRLITDGPGVVLDYGRRTRVISDNLRAAVAVRDGGCRFPECRRPMADCQVHHVEHWTRGGPTVPTNLAAVCLRHHQILHSHGWSAKLLPDATFEVTTPTGRTMRSQPRRASLLPLDELVAASQLKT